MAAPPVKLDALAPRDDPPGAQPAPAGREEELRRAEQALRDVPALNQRILEALPGGVVVVSRAGAVLKANAEGTRVLGLTYDALTASFVADFAPVTLREDGSVCPVEEYPVSRCLVTGQPQPPVTIGVRRPDGEVSWAVFTAVPLEAPGGGPPLGAVVTFIDITGRRRTEEERRRSEERFRSLVHSLPDYVALLDRDGLMVFNNRAGEGLRTADVQGKPCWAFLDPSCHERVRVALQRAFDERAADTIETTTLSARRYRTRVIPVRGEDGQVENALLVASEVPDQRRDEEARRRLESRIQQAQQLGSLAQLAGGIAHDFNNLLVGIRGNIELARRSVERGGGGAGHAARPHPAVALLEDATLATARAGDLVRQLLAYAGHGRLVVAPVDLGELVVDTLPLARAGLSRRADLRLELSHDLPAVEGDATQLRQVLMNLLTNATEALSGAAGRIWIRTGRASRERALAEATHRAGSLDAPEYVTLEVQDDGCGMDDLTAARIFDPFFTTKFTGRGLGLPALLGIVRGHHGAIQVTSRPGQGSTFRIYLPSLGRPAPRPEARVAAPGAAPRPVGARAGAVLVIDDEPHVRNVARLTLEQQGWEVLLAPDGRAGIELFREARARVRVVLLDLIMPDLDGEQVLDALRAMRPDVRVVLSSGYGEAAATERFVGRGLSGFLTKPYPIDALVDVVARAAEASEGAPADAAREADSHHHPGGRGLAATGRPRPDDPPAPDPERAP